MQELTELLATTREFINQNVLYIGFQTNLLPIKSQSKISLLVIEYMYIVEYIHQSMNSVLISVSFCQIPKLNSLIAL